MLLATILLCLTNILVFNAFVSPNLNSNKLSESEPVSQWSRYRNYGEFRLVQPGPGELMGIRESDFRPSSESRIYQDVSIRATPPPFPGTLRSSSQEDDADSKPVKGSERDPQRKPGKNYQFTGNTDDDGGQGSGSRRIRCLCDTPECVDNAQTTCFTTGHCYTQLLETEDGTPPITKGCIPGETPLLCENRRPSTARRWPYLICCNSDLCNAAGGLGLHLPAGKIPGTTDKGDPETSSTNSNSADNTHDGNHHDHDHASSENDTIVQDNFDGNGNTHQSIKVKYKSSLNNGTTSDRLVSPLASSFLIGGAVVVVVISAVGFYILRRDRRRPVTFYTDIEETTPDPKPGDPVNIQSQLGIEDSDEREPFTNASNRKSEIGVQNETCLDETQTPLKSDYEESVDVHQDEPESKC